MRRLRARWLGRLAYAEAWDLQRAIHEGRVDGRHDDDYLLLLEHPPVYTLGRGADRTNLLRDPTDLEGIGAEVVDVDRGGDVGCAPLPGKEKPFLAHSDPPGVFRGSHFGGPSRLCGGSPGRAWDPGSRPEQEWRADRVLATPLHK